MAYEIDFIGVGDEVKKDADAITIRWKDDNGDYKIAVYDGGLQAHGDKIVEHLNEYYFSDSTDKVIDCVHGSDLYFSWSRSCCFKHRQPCSGNRKHLQRCLHRYCSTRRLCRCNCIRSDPQRLW